MTEKKQNTIMLVGNTSSVFLDDLTPQTLACQTADNISQAAELAQKAHFKLIALSIPPSTARFVTELEKLRRSCNSKIVLLAQMYQEPMAMIFVHPDLEGKKLADDYIICPLAADDLSNYLATGTIEQSDTVKTKPDKKIAERIRMLEKLATEDDLTGLKNRRYIWEFARQIINYAQKHGGGVTLLIFDIDDFKHYNDQYGHLVGDSILKQTSTLIQRCCRKHDVVGRIGGDEFAVVFWDSPKSTDKQKADDRRAAAEHPNEPVFIAQRFRKQIEDTEFNAIGPAGKGVLTISGGLASFPRNGSDVEELFRKADEALLEAKASGKNQIYLVGQPNNNKQDTN